jgi:hypothetical protein
MFEGLIERKAIGNADACKKTDEETGGCSPHAEILAVRTPYLALLRQKLALIPETGYGSNSGEK